MAIRAIQPQYSNETENADKIRIFHGLNGLKNNNWFGNGMSSG
jgi:hypothetical protein